MYKESLPEQCPPQEASDEAIAEAYRMVYSDPPHIDHFKSKRALGLPALPGSDECGHASCSLSSKLSQIKRLAQLPKPRAEGAKIAKLSIPAAAGKWTKNKKGHIHFWMYSSFDPLSAFCGMVDD